MQKQKTAKPDGSGKQDEETVAGAVVIPQVAELLAAAATALTKQKKKSDLQTCECGAKGRSVCRPVRG